MFWHNGQRRRQPLKKTLVASAVLSQISPTLAIVGAGHRLVSSGSSVDGWGKAHQVRFSSRKSLHRYEYEQENKRQGAKCLRRASLFTFVELLTLGPALAWRWRGQGLGKLTTTP
jgi:hypothetical protein